MYHQNPAIDGQCDPDFLFETAAQTAFLTDQSFDSASVVIAWGDGTSPSINTGISTPRLYTHTYAATSGTFIIKVDRTSTTGVNYVQFFTALIDTINACLSNPCDPRAHCTDLPPPAGNGPNGRTCTCLPGYNGTGLLVNGGATPTCIDINACATAPCDVHAAQCTDLPAPAPGDFAGRICGGCQAGYSSGSGEPGTCMPPAACMNLVCDVNSVGCIPSAGAPNGVTCGPCNSGYSGDGVTCFPFDPCQSFPCDPNSSGCTVVAFVNTTAGRTCGACNSGFIGNGVVCTNIDACVVFPCLTNQMCADYPPPAPNLPVGRNCTCNAGYDNGGQQDQVACIQINACKNNPCGGFQQACTDLPPPNGDGPSGRTCACNVGYTGPMAGPCVDVNACTTNPCGTTQTCTDLPAPAPNTAAGRACVCNSGYAPINSGASCMDINACINHPCAATELCADLAAPALDDNSGRTCTACATGTSPSAMGVCVDINACTPFPCDQGQTCSDLPPPALGDASGRTCGGGGGGGGSSNAAVIAGVVVAIVLLLLLLLLWYFCLYRKKYGVAISQDATATGWPENPAIYDVTVTNMGRREDNFDITFSASKWKTTVSQNSIEKLGAREHVMIKVFVWISTTAAPGESDQVTVTATSRGDESKFDSCTLTTTNTGTPVGSSQRGTLPPGASSTTGGSPDDDQVVFIWM